MRLIKKFVLISGIFLSLIVMVLSGAGMYLYYHPEQIKPVMERSLASATGSSCTIERISWSMQPLSLEAGGIFLNGLKPQQAFSIELPFIRADMAIEGPWGRRTLVLENIQINGISMNFTSPYLLPENKGASFPARMIQGLVSLFFFRDIRFHSGEILDGQISTVQGDQTVRAYKIHAKADADEPLLFSFALEAGNASRNMDFTAPEVTLVSGSAFDLSDPKLSGTLQAKGMKFRNAGLGIPRMAVQSQFTYSHATQHLNVENLDIRCKGIALTPDSGSSLSPVDIHFTADGVSIQYPVIEITNAALQVPQVKVRTGNREILTGNIVFHIPAGQIDTEKRAALIPAVRCDAFGLKNVLLDMGLEEGRINLMLQGKNTALLHAAAVYQFLPSDWAFSANDAIQIEVSGPEAGPWQVGATLSFEDLAFKNKDESLMGEALILSTKAESVIDLKNSTITFSADLAAKTGEALYDRYYLNLAENPVTVSCNGAWRFKERFFQLYRLKGELTDILPIEIQGFLKQWTSIAGAGGAPGSDAGRDADFMVIIPKVPLTPIFQLLLQEPYKTEKPFLATLETGGTVSAEVRLKESGKERQVVGRIGWREGSIYLPDKGTALKGIHVDLPVWYETGMSKNAVEWLKGKLAIQSVTVPPLPEQSLNILMDAGPNRISVDSPTVIRIPGGEMRLGAVQMENLFSPDISVHTRLDFKAINLQSLLTGIGALPPEEKIDGMITGALDPVRYENHTVASQGKLAADVFGGTIILSDLGASGIFTSVPVFKLNANWDDLLLAEMTTDTTFGKIEGVLKGHLRDVEIAYGQPQKFDLLLETVQKKGIPQTISIKAVDNIAQIGGGQSPFMGLAGSFASVFEKFPYEKIGIRAYLENDMFTVNGTSKEDGTEYLVKRRSFSGINIVNQNPDNRISFKDMVKRIQRITHKGGAVVN
ncbi:MAG: hypothetical protein C4518_08010 [Desulfobacteraceae bacterium]|nr:MAG: hypothetical protein C4518_08010 [Desulfobacteraceae bacterium]